MTRSLALVAAMAALPAVAAADDPPDDHPGGRPEVAVAAEVFAFGDWTRTDADTATRFDLRRAELGAELGFGDRGGAEIRLEAIRSAAPQSAIGIDGNSLVVRVKRASAHAAWALGPVVLEARGGLIIDPWIEAVERDYPLRALSLTTAEEARLMSSSDLGAALVLRGWDERARLHLAFTNGEGRNQLEQNDGKNSAAVLSVEAARIARGRILVHGLARDGSIGAGGVRSHRFGVAVSLATPRVAVGAELVRALGVAERPDVTGLAAAGWAEGRVLPRFGVAARIDLLRLDGPAAQDLSTTRATVALWHDVWSDAGGGGLRGYLAGQLDRAGTGAAPVPDVPAATDAVRILVIVAATARKAPP